MTTTTQGYSEAEVRAFATHLDAALRRNAERAEAMAKLRRVCAGEPPEPPSPPPLTWLVDPFRQPPDKWPNGGSVGGGGHTDNANRTSPIGSPAPSALAIAVGLVSFFVIFFVVAAVVYLR